MKNVQTNELSAAARESIKREVMELTEEECRALLEEITSTGSTGCIRQL